jgi:hypothetical protein
MRFSKNLKKDPLVLFFNNGSYSVKVGDLVRVTGRPRDGWVPFLGIIVEVDGHQYKVRPVSHDKWVYALDKRDMEPIDADK